MRAPGFEHLAIVHTTRASAAGRTSKDLDPIKQALALATQMTALKGHHPVIRRLPIVVGILTLINPNAQAISPAVSEAENASGVAHGG